jgi:hypothetical protein
MDRVLYRTCLAGERHSGGAVEAGMVPAKYAVAGLQRCAHHADFVESGVTLAADNKRLAVQSAGNEKYLHQILVTVRGHKKL